MGLYLLKRKLDVKKFSFSCHMQTLELCMVSVQENHAQRLEILSRKVMYERVLTIVPSGE